MERPIWADPLDLHGQHEDVSLWRGHISGCPHLGSWPPRVGRIGYEQLSPSRIRSIFEYARFTDVDGWVAAFERRVAEIDRAACKT